MTGNVSIRLKSVLIRRKEYKLYGKALRKPFVRMGTCKVIVGREISGLPYNVLDTAGFKIFQMEGLADSFLEIVHSILKQDTVLCVNDESIPETFITPENNENDGNYIINLIDIQKNHSQVTSKQILMPILKKSQFYELEIICSHIPPWVDIELEKLGLEKDVDEINSNLYKLKIYHKTCKI